MIYTIPRYPVHLIDFVTAANGRRVTIRPMLPQDFKLQREFFRSLSARARYYRFMTSFNELPDGVAERLGKINYSSHLANNRLLELTTRHPVSIQRVGD
jgi:acetyltransferase